METMVRPQDDIPLRLAVVLNVRRNTVMVGEKSSTVTSPSDKKVMATVRKDTFNKSKPFTLQASDVNQPSVTAMLIDWIFAIV